MDAEISELPKAYSYIRFSSPEQRKGDSLRRQLVRSREYAKAHDLDYQEKSFRDLGMSASKGRHRKAGQLGQFLEAVEQGIILPGSYLLVESMDRLSRETVPDALQNFLAIINRGITVVTFRDGRIYSHESIREDWTQLIISIAFMTSAYEEVKRKSDHSTEFWDAKRANIATKKMTGNVPSWLESYGKPVEYRLVPERASIVRWIFEQAKAGKGNFRIADELNKKHEAGLPGFGPWKRNKRKIDRWHTSYIEKIIKNPAVVGDCQPYKGEEGKRVPVGGVQPGYYPAVIERALFDEVHKLRSGRTIMFPGQIGESVSNLFSGLLFCARCDRPVIFLNKSPYNYLRLPRPLPDGRRVKTWRYDHFEPLFLRAVGALDLGRIFREDTTAPVVAKAAVAEIRAELARVQNAQNRLVALTEAGDGELKAVASRLSELQHEGDLLKSKLIAAEREEAKVLSAQRDASRTAANIQRLFRDNDFESRMRLRTEIRQIVRRVRVWLPVEPTAKEAENDKKFETLLQKIKTASGGRARIVAIEDQGYAFEIEFENGVKRMVHRGTNNEPLLASDTTSNASPMLGSIIVNPMTTPPRAHDTGGR